MAIALYRRPMGVMMYGNCFVQEEYGSDVMAIVLYSRPMEVMMY